MSGSPKTGSFIEERISFFQQAASGSQSENVPSSKDIEEIVENFGIKLREKRIAENQSKNQNHNIDKPSDNTISNTLENYQKYCMDNAKMDDMFGLNSFAEDDEDNYIFESYNRDGDELIITVLEIKQKPLNSTDSFEDNGAVIHQNEYPDDSTNYTKPDLIFMLEDQPETPDLIYEPKEVYQEKEEDKEVEEKEVEDKEVEEKEEENAKCDCHRKKPRLIKQKSEIIYSSSEEEKCSPSNASPRDDVKLRKPRLRSSSSLNSENYPKMRQTIKGHNYEQEFVKLLKELSIHNNAHTSNKVEEKEIDLSKQNQNGDLVDTVLKEQKNSTAKKDVNSEENARCGEYFENYAVKDLGSPKIQRQKSQQPKDKISYIIEELIETEDQYTAGLEKVVRDYIPYVHQKTPPNLVGKTTYLFSNISEIYKESVNIGIALKNAENDYDEIAKVFINADKMLELYPQYSKNKPRADMYLKDFEPIIKNRQKELNDRLDLNSYLLTPVQRLGKYVLMFENIQKELNKMKTPSTWIDQVIEKIKKIMRKGNDYLAIDSIKNIKINLYEQGSFIAREKFNLLKPKKMESMIFLFENIIVFTTTSLNNLEEFICFDFIHLKDLTIAVFEDDELIFDLWNFTIKKSNKNLVPYTLEAKTPKIKEYWTKLIRERLWYQLEKAKRMQRISQISPPKPVRRAPPRPSGWQTRSTFYIKKD